MIKKITVLAAALVLVIISAAACAANDQQVSAQSSQQTSADASDQVQGNVGGAKDGTGSSEVNQKQIERETQKMKEEGVVDKNGRSAPGVDLNDYPGLG